MNTDSTLGSDQDYLFYFENRESLIDVYPEVPEGWELDPVSFWLFKNKVPRGVLLIKEISPPYVIFVLDLFERYHVACLIGHPNKVCVLDYDNTIIKEIGIVEDAWSEECDKLEEQGYKWLDENYPDWRDPTKYWEDQIGE